jgi:curved DNA-binding protein CbpA
MSDHQRALAAAYQAMGLRPGDDFDCVKAAFRGAVKSLHPDKTPDTPETRKNLQRLLAAYEVLRVHAPRTYHLVLTPDEARKGGLRTLDFGERSALVRLPPDVKTGHCFKPVGDSRWTVAITVKDIMLEADTELEKLEEQREAERKRIAAFRAEQAAQRHAEDTSSALAGILGKVTKLFRRDRPAA